MLSKDLKKNSLDLSTREFQSATLLHLWRLISTLCAKPLLELPSIPLSLSVTKLAFPELQPLVLLLVFSRISRSMPPLRVWWRLFLESILICSRWTDTQWIPPRILFSEVNLKLSRPLSPH